VKLSRWATGCWILAAAGFICAVVYVPHGTEAQGQRLCVCIMLGIIGLMCQVCRK
jgi:hypothetical protein